MTIKMKDYLSGHNFDLKRYLSSLIDEFKTRQKHQNNLITKYVQ